MAQSSAQPDRPGKKDCQSYIQTGRCDYRRTCRHNHPPHLRHKFPEKTDAPVCKFFVRGVCKNGSSCSFRHIKESDGSGPMRQFTRQRTNESRYEFEDLRQRRDETASGFKPPRTPMNPSVNAQENLQEQRHGYSKRQRRESQENPQGQRFMKMTENHNVYARNQLNPEQHRQRELERHRMETRLRVHQELPEKTDPPVCQYFLRGRCKKGSNCIFRHIRNRDGSEPTRQSISQRATESREEFEERVFKRPRVKRQRDRIERQRKEAQENLQEQRQRHNIERQRREAQDNLQEQRQRHNIERQRREAQVNLQEQRKTHNIERQRREAQDNLQEQRLVMEIPDNQNVEAHNQQNLEEQRKLEIERQRTEDRLRLDQMRPTALFDERSRPKEGIEELGLKDFQGI